MKKSFLLIFLLLFNFLNNSYSQETFYLNRNNDTIRFQKTNYYYFEFKNTIDSTFQDSISLILKDYLVNGLGKSPDEIAADILKKNK